MKFSALLVFSVLWFTLLLPADGAHGVVLGRPDAPTRDPAGFLFGKGALDFAGGTVVHINAGMAGAGGRASCSASASATAADAMPPHSLAMTMIGASLLWVGWFGFNAGSNLEATGTAVLAMRQHRAWRPRPRRCRGCSRSGCSRASRSMLGAASGAVAGLVAITPACRLRRPDGRDRARHALPAWCACGRVSGLKHALGYDDSLDVFGVHGDRRHHRRDRHRHLVVARRSAAPACSTTAPCKVGDFVMGTQVIEPAVGRGHRGGLVGRGELRAVQAHRHDHGAARAGRVRSARAWTSPPTARRPTTPDNDSPPETFPAPQGARFF
ncbi:MAG: hypothetical protein MZV65_54275 [Chromatiales bacterium]|nr:hypothetical protein [Chromatiales bacterium]